MQLSRMERGAVEPHEDETLRGLTEVVLGELAAGRVRRGGPLPAGGPAAVKVCVTGRVGSVLPQVGIGAEVALRELTRALVLGSADPTEAWCVGHLHCAPLPVAVAADLAASALNPSMDSWDQAPAAAAIEAEVAAALAALIYPEAVAPDAVITSGATESNLVAVLLARETARASGGSAVQVVCGDNAHHSVARAAWLLGLPKPITVNCPTGVLAAAEVGRVLRGHRRWPVLVVATAGTTDAGLIDPLSELADVVAAHGAWLHVDAAYGGPLLFSDELRSRLAGVGAADSVAFDLHKFGWQPVAAGVLAVRDAAVLAGLAHRTEYLNADDDLTAGLPDLLGRSIRTSRRPDAFKIAVTMRALGKAGLAGLVEHCVCAAEKFAQIVDTHPRMRRRPGAVGISTVLFRPVVADELGFEEGDALVSRVRRELLAEGRAVLGRARVADSDGRIKLWLKATLLHPQTSGDDLAPLLDLVADLAG